MKIFLETIKTSTKPGDRVEMKQVDITKSTDVAKAQTDLEAVTTAKAYTVRKHFCRHDEGKPCTVEIIKVVTSPDITRS